MIHRLLSVLGSSAALILSAGSAHADDEDDGTAGLSPSSEWKLREYDDKCRMSRTFGKGEERTTLWLDKGGPGPGVNMTLIGNTMRHPFGPNISVAFAPNEPRSRNYIRSTSSKGRPVIALFGVQPVPLNPAPQRVSLEQAIAGEESVDLSDGVLSTEITPEDAQARLETIEAIEIEGALMEPVRLETGKMVETLAELSRCTEGLTERLRINAEASGGSATGPKPKDQMTWAKKMQENYPAHLLWDGQEARVGVRLTINTAGRVSFCEITEYVGPASFNDTACLELLRHARFDPARNAAGEAVPAFWKTRITYMIGN